MNGPCLTFSGTPPGPCSACGQAEAKHYNPWGKPDHCAASGCTLFLEPGPVWGVGPDDAKLFMLGEGPGADEVDFPHHRAERFKPFVGGAGRILTALSAHAGINRKLCFIDNCVRCRPPGNRTPTPFELECCAHFLVKEIRRINPNVLVALGEVPLNVLTDEKGIGLHRGVPIPGFEGRKVFPTWHPAFIARSQHNWPFSVHDLARASAESTFPDIRRVPFNIVRTANAADDRLSVLDSARARGAFTFDFETTGLTPDRSAIQMVGIVARDNEARVYDWTPSAQQLFQELLDEPGVEVVGQNILYFDLPFAAAKGTSIDKAWLKVFDTMVAFHLANSSYGQTPVHEQKAGTYRVRGAEKDLTMIASCHTDIPYWKSRTAYRADLRGVCGTDCIATDRAALTAATGLKAELKAYDMLDLYYKHVLPVHPVLYQMTKRGIRCDQERAAGWMIILEKQADQMEVELKEGLGDPNLNLNSPKQLMDLLYGKLGLPTQFTHDKKKGMRPTANADALEALAANHPESSILRTLVDIRHLRKLAATNITPGLESPDGRFHPKFGVSKAATGRFNSWDPNAQNQPEDIRDIWVADDDEHVLLASDWSQIEWRLGMVLSGDPVGLDLLARGVDNHRAVYSEVFGVPFDSVTDYQRHTSKFIVYGLGYGRGAQSISDGYSLPMGEVQSFIGRFFQRFAAYARWREENLRFVKKHHYLSNAFKRRRWWYTWAVTEVYNYPMQSTAADMMYDALIELEAQLPKGAELCLTVHDEVVLNVAKDVVREAWNCVKEVMERTWPQIVEASAYPEVVRSFYPNGWFCPADVHIGRNWKQAKSKDPADKAVRAELERYFGLTP
jgi:uracil-DNA glycosylase family 4